MTSAVRYTRIFILIALFFLSIHYPTASYAQLLPMDTIICSSDSIQLNVKVAGNGFPCIFVHGGPGGGFQSFEKLGGQSLEQYLTMIYYDQRGSGSSANATNYSLDRMVEDIEELRIKLRLDKVFLLSHSFGGIIAVNYGKKYPEHVKGLILVNATLHFLNTTSLKEQLAYGYQLLKRENSIGDTSRIKLLEDMAVVRQEMSGKRVAYKFLTDDIQTIIQMDSLDERYPRTNDFGETLMVPLLDSTKPLIYPAYTKDYTPISATLFMPVLVITGTRDYAIGIHHYRSFQFPHQQVVKIDGGHLLYYERNKAFAEAVGSFIRSNP